MACIFQRRESQSGCASGGGSPLASDQWPATAPPAASVR